MKINQFCYKLFNQLQSEEIIYAVLRNYSSLPYNTAGSDLDIWIDSSCKDRFFSIVNDVTYDSSSHIVSVLHDSRCPKFCFLNSEEGFQMDVFIGSLCYQNHVMIPEDDIHCHIVNYHGIKILDDIFADLLAYLKEIINNERCDEKYIKPLVGSKRSFTKDYLKENLSLFPESFISSLYDHLVNDRLQCCAKELSLAAKKSIVNHHSFFYKTKKLKRFFFPPGYVIAIEGTDGSGKSTIINTITPILNEAFHNGIVYNHLRPNAIPDLGVLLGKKEKQEAGVVNTDPHALKPSGFLGSLVRWGYYLIDYTFGYMKVVWPVIHTKSKVFIFDRYYYDYYIDQKRSRTSLPRWVLRLAELFIPKPDLILCLGGDAKKIYARKPETSLKEVERQTYELQRFCNKRKNAVWVDTTTSVEASVSVAMKAIVEMMSIRYKNVFVR